MALLNYSTEIDVHKTLGEVQGALARHGATKMTITYDGQGTPIGLIFVIATQAIGERAYALPANVENVWRVMSRQSSQGKIPQRLATKQQATRVAWRIIKDWVEAQLAFTETEIVTIDQVMLPYLVVNDRGETVYDVMARHQMALPEAGER